MSSHHLRVLLAFACLFSAAAASALTLGEARTASHVGERVTVEIDYRLAPGESLDAGCIHFAGTREGGKSINQGAISLRPGDGVIVVRSSHFVETPEVRLPLQVGCGFDLKLEFGVKLVTPESRILPPVPEQVAGFGGGASRPAERPAFRTPVSPGGRSAVASPVVLPAPPAEPHRSARGSGQLYSGKIAVMNGRPDFRDRVVLGAGPGMVGEPRLLLANELASWRNIDEADTPRRQLFRLEYRVLQALHDQAQSQLDTAEKLRQLDSTLSELQRLGQAVVQQDFRLQASAQTNSSSPAGASMPEPVPVAVPTSSPTPAVAPTSPPVSVPVTTPHPIREPDGLWLEWLIWALLAVLVIGLLVVGLRRVRLARERQAEEPLPVPKAVIDPPRDAESEFFDDEPVPAFRRVRAFQAPAAGVAGVATAPSVLPKVADDVATPFAAKPSAPPPPVAQKEPPIPPHRPEQLDVEPVMELADIMLSFGRVKGAAQALQEFVDQNPEDALAPWIRLMDVYRIAGMRGEFERVAANLNQHFNVEIQRWEAMAAQNASTGTPPSSETLPIDWQTAAREQRGIEDLAHIASRIVGLWPGYDCLLYLEQLLRDTRGGQRSGFSMPVVEELMFLIDLLQTLAKMELEAATPMT